MIAVAPNCQGASPVTDLSRGRAVVTDDFGAIAASATRVAAAVRQTPLRRPGTTAALAPKGASRGSLPKALGTARRDTVAATRSWHQGGAVDLHRLGYPGTRDTAVILGAGATRGASFVPAVGLHKPPIDLDYFTQLRVSASGRTDHAQRLIEFVIEEFGSLDVGMETFYSQVQLYDKFVGEIPKGVKGRARKYQYALQYFLESVPDLFGGCLAGQRCSHHDALVRGLTARDTIVSFNYDCLADRSLAAVGGRRWNPATGYGINVVGGTTAWKDHTGTGRMPKTSLTLLKPHGSLNWRKASGGTRLRPDEYAAREAAELVIVPPLWIKSYDAKPFDDVWSALRRTLSTTKALIFVGYSLPTTDVYTQAALRLDVVGLDFLCIVNPDADARSRIRTVLKSAISPRTVITELDLLAELATLLTPASAVSGAVASP